MTALPAHVAPGAVPSTPVQGTIPSAQVKQGKKTSREGRSFLDITKIVAKILAGVALFCIGAAALAALVVGIILIINPAGFGIGNILGAGLSTAGLKIGIVVTQIVGFLARQAVSITIVSAIVLGVTGAAAAALTVIGLRCKNKNSESDAEEGAGNTERVGETQGAISDSEDPIDYSTEG